MRKILATVLALTMLYGAVALGNYNATQGSGTPFGSVVVSAVHYAQQFICDLTTPAQCAAVDASGNLSVKSSTLSTAANQTSALTKLDTINTSINSPIPLGGNRIGYVSDDPCSQLVKTNLPISFQTTSSTQLIALSGSTKIYVCSLSLIASAATVFSITGGTGSACGTPAALIGTTVAAHGLSLPATGGLTLGNGAGTVAVTGVGSELCIVQTGAGDLSGNLTYVQQ